MKYKNEIKLYKRTRASRHSTSRKRFLRKRNKKLKILIFILEIILAIIFIFYFLFFSNFFKIDKAAISFNNRKSELILEDEIQEIISDFMNKKYFSILAGNNLILLKTNLLKNKIKQDSRISSVFINKKLFPRCKLLVKIEQVEPVANLIILGDKKIYYLNSLGQIIMPSTNNSGNQLLYEMPVFYDQSSINIKKANVVKFFNNLLSFINNSILKNINGVNINKIDIDEEGSILTAKMTTIDNWQIFINSEININEQLVKLNKILSQKIGIEERKELKYIDLRYGNKIFHKFIDLDEEEIESLE